MSKVHIICKRAEDGSGWVGRTGVTCIDRENHIYISGKWDFNLVEAEALVGGDLYLHETKGDKSAFGGRIIEVREASLPHKARDQRVEFVIKASPDHRGVPWEGASHAMAWTSGILLDD